MKVAVAQFNAIVGDVAGNASRIAKLSREAYALGARVVVTPELSLCGYPAEDLLLRPAFIAACESALLDLASQLRDLPGLQVVVGHPKGHDIRTKSYAVQQRFNAASVLCDGKVLGTYTKRELPNYQVFDEKRYFTPGGRPLVFEAEGVRFGINICEDAWFDAAPKAAKQAGAQVLLVPNASPFHVGKAGERIAQMAKPAREHAMPVVYAHLVGGQDEVVFDGDSFVLNADGELCARAARFAEELLLVEVHASQSGALELSGPIAAPQSTEQQIWSALVLGVRDYLGKNGFPGAIIGLSGGIDSAVVLAVAVEALGAEHVRAVMMPSPYTADISWIDARDMAKRLGVQYDEIAIAPMFDAFRTSLSSEFAGLAEDATEENIQARIRGTLLMAVSNKSGRIVLTTGNKSEMATGYCTLYGDMAGGFAVIKDVAKTMVYRLAEWRNQQARERGEVEPIPQRIITRPPSAELRPNQTDQDSLPPYEVLDAILERYMEQDQPIEQIIEAGFSAADVERVTRLIKVNEYKRRQAPVGIRVTHRSFGKDWRYPITSKFRG